MFMYSVQQSRKVSVREKYAHSDIRLFKVITCTHLPTQALLVAIVVPINVNETVFEVTMFSIIPIDNRHSSCFNGLH